jgi:SAM-dependent methyltransferase
MVKNKDRFTNKAGIYKKYRPSYPKELIDYLYSQSGFNQDSIIADMGSGTGILSRLFIERGNIVYCVEPNDDMRETAERDLSESKRFISINASAESTDLQDRSVDFISAAQSFHWFDKHAFKSECQRLLRPDGKVIIIWNTRDHEYEIIKKESMFREEYCSDKKGLKDGGKLVRDWSDFFVGGVCEHMTCRNDLVLNRDSYIGINLSRSWAPREEQDSEKYSGFVCMLNELFDEYSDNGVLNIPYFTQCYIGRV